MIAVKLQGRLGNQLFQYAFIYVAAKKLNTSFYLDKSIESFIPGKYFNIQSDFLSPFDKLFSIQGYKNIFNIYLKKYFYNTLNRIVLNNKSTVIDNYQSDYSLKNNCLYEGYFQSEKYFESYKAEVRQFLTIKKLYQDAFYKIQQTVFPSKKKIVVHIRRRDYLDLAMALPLAYYKAAIDMVNDENSAYVFVSDDYQFIEKEFAYIKNKYISNNDEIIDLQFLMNADVCILSNSSFSWWGAWLNTKPDKIVYAPKNWLGFETQNEYPVGIAHNLDFNWISL